MPFLQEFLQETGLLRLLSWEHGSMVHTLANAFPALFFAFPSFVLYRHVNFPSVVRFHSF